MAEPTQINDINSDLPSLDDFASQDRRREVTDSMIRYEQEKDTPIPEFGTEMFDQDHVTSISDGYSENAVKNIMESPSQEGYKPFLPDGSKSQSGSTVGDYFDEGELPHWGVMRMSGDAWNGAIAGGLYATDGIIQSFVDAANSVSDDPNQDVKFFGYVGDLMMQHGGPAKDFGRDLGRMMIPWLPMFKAVKGVAGSLQASPRFISKLPDILLSKGHRLGQFLGKPIPAGAVAQFMVGSMAYKPSERGAGGHMLQVMDEWFGKTLGHKPIAEYMQTDDPTKAQDALSRVYNGFAEMMFQLGMDKFILPAAQKAGIAIMNSKYGVRELAKRITDMVKLEKHALVSDASFRANAHGKSSSYVVINQEGKLSLVDRGDGALERVVDGAVVPKGSPVIKAGVEGEPMQTTFGMQLPSSPDEGLQAMYSMFKDGSLEKTIMDARTIDEKMALIKDMTTVLTSSVGKASKTGQKTMDEMIKDSNQVLRDLWGFDKSGLMARQKGSPINEPIMIAYARATDSSFNELLLATQKLGSATKSSQRDAYNEFFRTLRNYSGLSRQWFDDIKPMTGRMLGINRWINKRFDDLIDSPEFAKVMAMEDGASMQDVMRLAAVMNEAYLTMGKKGLSKAVNEFGKSGYVDAFYEGWIGLGLLANPALHMLNFSVGMLNVGTQISSKQAGAVWSRMTGHGDVKMGEAFAGMVGVTSGIITALRSAVRAGVTGDSMPAFSGMKLEHWANTKSLSSKNLGLEDNTIGLAIDGLGKAARFNNRMLLSEDELVKVFSYEAERYMLGYRKAMEVLKKGGHKWNWEKFQTIFKEVAENPRTHMVDGVSIHDRAIEMGKLNTFQRTLGTLGKSMQRMQTDVPLLRLWVPFVKVLSNIPKFTAQHTPLAGLYPKVNPLTGKPTMRSIYNMPQSQQMEEAGRMTIGSMFMFLGGMMYYNGMMTPHDTWDWKKEKQRKQVGNKPAMSVRHMDDQGGKWWTDMSRLQPYSEWMAAGAQLVKSVKNEDHDTVADRWLQLLWSGKSTFANTTWLPNLEKAVSPFNQRAEPHKFKQLMYSLMPPAIPATIRSGRRADVKRGGNIPTEFEPFSFTLEDKSKGVPLDLSKVAAKWRSSISPDHLFGERDWRGRETYSHDTEEAAKKGVTAFNFPPILTTGMNSFMPVRRDKSDKLDREVDDLGIVFDKPSAVVHNPIEGKPTRMLPWEYDYYRFLIGNIKSPITGKTMPETMKKIIGTDWYNKLDDEAVGKFPKDKVSVLTDVYNEFNDFAKNYVIHNSPINDRMKTGELGNVRMGNIPSRSHRGLQ